MDAIWSWAILGLVLLAVEMLSGTFYILCFGVAALVVAASLWLFPALPLSAQLLIFILLSLLTLAVWRRKIASRQPDLRIGQSQDDSIGKAGHITETVSPEQNGRIVFTVPVMGSREWTVIADERIEVGEAAEVVAIVGNYLRVRRKTN